MIVSSKYSHVIFSERRILHDYDKYGDSPTCLNDKFNIGNIEATIQGFGLTGPEAIKGSKKLLEAKVITATNENCTRWVKGNAKRVEFGEALPYGRGYTFAELPDGIDHGILCSWGIENEDGIITVSLSSKTFKIKQKQ